jgi:sugar phosphate isomerase/epimerase
MTTRTRRSFLGAAGTAFLPGAVFGGRRFSKPLGLQLYTLRKMFPRQAREALRGAAEIGYTEVETLPGGSREFDPYFKEFGLQPVAGHWESPLVTGNWAAWRVQFPTGQPEGYTWDAAIETTAEIGMKFMVISYLMPAERRGKGGFLRIADQLNQAGERAKASGLTLCYHNHGFEFSGWSGSSPFDILMENCDPELVSWELDVFWCSLAGADPVEILTRYPNRIPLLHLKDKLRGARKLTEERMATPDLYKEVGAGELDFAAILLAAGESGVEHYFVEQDECPGSPLDSIRQSYQYLRRLEL